MGIDMNWHEAEGYHVLNFYEKRTLESSVQSYVFARIRAPIKDFYKRRSPFKLDIKPFSEKETDRLEGYVLALNSFHDYLIDTGFSGPPIPPGSIVDFQPIERIAA